MRKQKNKINKKAGIFAAGMVLAMIIFITTAWFAFSTTNKKISREMLCLSVLNSYYNEEDRFMLYARESAKIAASQAFYLIAKDAAVNLKENSCNVRNNYIIWTESCHPETESIKEKFLNYYNKTFSELIKNYPNKVQPEYFLLLENDTLILMAQPIRFTSEKQETFAKYTINYSFDPSFMLNLPEQKIYLEDFETIYNKIKACNNNSSCLEDISFEHWETSLEEFATYYLFNLKTKNFYFFQDDTQKYEKIELGFIIEK